MESNKSRICVSICERTIEAIQQACARVGDLGDLVEVRLDCLDLFQGGETFHDLESLLQNIPRPVIVTYRPVEQGGQQQLDAKSRLVFWLFKRPDAELFDIEFDIATPPSLLHYGKDIDWSRVICSYHNFHGVPANLFHIYERMLSSPARILKIAVQANDATDCIPVLKLLERGLKEGREMIAIAMGTAGVATRILGPSRGAFLTYAALEHEAATAPGQISARELREVYRLEKIDRGTQIFGLTGLPVSHSVSPQVHNAAFDAVGINAVYIPFEVRDVEAFIRRMVHPRTREIDWNMRGLSVTAPHKTAVMDHLDWIEPAAQEIGAVNTILVADDVLQGYNTDATGFLKPLMQKFGPLRDVRCAVIGSGGAASAAVWALSQERAKVTIFARNAKSAESLAGKAAATWDFLEGSVFAGFDVVINATTQGTAGQCESETPAIARQLRGARLAYDLVYNPGETKFLREARGAGCETLGGLSMLVAQAAEQFRLWTGAIGCESVMFDAAERALGRKQR
ncbi:MAG: shikimate dehydrogenase [Acidobacteriota bacterium]|nr:shikimate dehydrogenase [Acidobacteriota bacterium]